VTVAGECAAWIVRGRALRLDRPLVLGILNVTPDSFSDGGAFLAPADALAHAERMLGEGADLLDVGGESTRPQGAKPVSAAEEMRRVLPVVSALRAAHPDLPLSVDTVKADVAEAALAAGADIINDVSALRLDARMGEVCARAGAGVILMHSRGTVSDMASYEHAHYGDVVAEVMSELRARAAAAERCGVAAESIALDPGIGFSKRSEHSLALLGTLREFAALGFPLVLGVSRKRVIGEAGGGTDAADRVDGTTAANVLGLAAGARIFRVHDVRAARRALDVAWAVLRAGGAV
jgi:dihydropteroate synthase